MGAQLGGGGAFSDINMTPLIDIVLVVLIIMMVNIPVQVEQMGVKLPSTEPPPPTPPDPVEQLVVAMYADGTIALNRKLMPEDILFAEVSRRLRPMTKKVVFIDADASINFGVVIDMVDVAKEAGAEKVSFSKMKETGPLPYTEVHQGALPRGVYPGSPSTAGAMTEKQADDQFQPMVPQVESCYAQRLGENPSLTGRIVVMVDVGPEGEIMASGVETNTTEDEALGQCILDALPGLTYEALGYPNTARIKYPFIFSPG
ncbi:MAG: biopolymer transporter ExbD [Alphaproteobacteria bacterium]|nr:biopolymer transporter ExbD [Alphaproteobacteria bacterium]